METVAQAGDDDDMPAKKPARPAPAFLRKWRLHRSLTLEQVGNIVGKGAQAVHKWEVGKTPVDLETLKLLAQAYETTPDALLFDPADDGLAQRMRAAHAVLKTLPPEDAESWIAVGRAMTAGRKPPDAN